MILAHGVAIGHSHLATGSQCQDTLGIARQGDTLVFAVADGAGSASSAQEGSILAAKAFCESVIDSISANPSQECPKLKYLTRAFHHARSAIEQEAKEQGRKLQDFHTTLLGGLFTGGMLRCVSIGDTMGFVVDHAGQIRSLVKPKKGEFINETVFLTSQDWQDYLSVSDAFENPKGLACCSDGLLNILYSMIPEDDEWKVIPHEDVMRNMLDSIREESIAQELNEGVVNMLSGQKANALNDDDKCLLLVRFKSAAKRGGDSEGTIGHGPDHQPYTGLWQRWRGKHIRHSGGEGALRKDI